LGRGYDLNAVRCSGILRVLLGLVPSSELPMGGTPTTNMGKRCILNGRMTMEAWFTPSLHRVQCNLDSCTFTHCNRSFLTISYNICPREAPTFGAPQRSGVRRPVRVGQEAEVPNLSSHLLLLQIPFCPQSGPTGRAF